HDGRTAGVSIKRRGDAAFRPFTEACGTVSPSKFANIVIREGDQVMIESAGGAGYGPPEEREADLVLRDVEEGLVSADSARAHYRVALLPENGRVHVAEHETALLRASAGVHRTGRAADVTEETWDWIQDTNVKGMFFACQAVGPHMIANRRGKIVNIGSIISAIGLGYNVPYAASKGAVWQLTRSLALEW